MPSPPRPLRALRPGAALLAMNGAVELRFGDEEVHVLRTDAPARVREVLAQLDGRHDRAAVLANLGPGHEEMLDALVDQLGRAGILAAAPFDAADEVSAYLAHTAQGGGDPAAILRSATAAVVGHARSAELLARVLGEHGLDARVVPREAVGDERADLLVCACDQPDLALLLAVNDAACRARTACLFVDLSHGRHATVGPFYVPGEGACQRCLRARLRENTAAHAELQAAERAMIEGGAPLPAFGCLPAHRYLAAGLAAGEVVAFLVKHRPLRTLNRALTVALEEARMWSEPVWRVPWCEACGRA